MYNCVKLGTLTRIRTGKLDANASSTDGTYPFFTCSREVLRIATYSYDCECVLVAGNGDLNVKYYAGKFDAYQRTYIIESIDKSKLLTKYLYFFLDIYVEVLRTQSIGGVIKYIKLGNLADALIPLPGIEKQAEIVDCLETCNVIIDRIQQQLTKLDELVKSRFVEMFGENVPTVQLGSVCQMINGDRGKNYPSGEDFVPMGVPFVNAGHLQEGRVDFSSMNYITEEKYALLSQGKMRRNDILYCLRGSLGKHGLVDFERGAVASSLVILRCNDQRILPQFLFYAIETPEIEKQLKAANNGSSQPNLSAASVKAYNIKLPSINKQAEFAAFVSEVDKSKLAVKQSLEKLETLKKSLMQEYFG